MRAENLRVAKWGVAYDQLRALLLGNGHVPIVPPDRQDSGEWLWWSVPHDVVAIAGGLATPRHRAAVTAAVRPVRAEHGWEEKAVGMVWRAAAMAGEGAWGRFAGL